MSTPAKMTATNEQIQLLIDNLETFYCIWNSLHPNFHDRLRTDAHWKELASIVSLSIVDLKRTYQTMRKKFRDEHHARTEKLPSGSGAPKKRKGAYSYYESLIFLLPTMKKRESRSNLSLSTSANSDDIVGNKSIDAPTPAVQETSVNLDDTLLMSPTSSSARPPSSLAKKRKRENEVTVRQGERAALQAKCLEVLDKPEPKQDMVHHWAMTVADDVRQIRDPLVRRRLMHDISGRLIAAIEQESQPSQSSSNYAEMQPGDAAASYYSTHSWQP